MFVLRKLRLQLYGKAEEPNIRFRLITRCLFCADDRAKNLRPKRNIRTAMHHEIMMYAIAQERLAPFEQTHTHTHAPGNDDYGPERENVSSQ